MSKYMKYTIIVNILIVVSLIFFIPKDQASHAPLPDFQQPIIVEPIIIEVTPLTKMQARVTAYSPHDNVSGINNDGDPTTTSTGTYPTQGTIAVDPRIIPYGTTIYIPGYGVGTASDTGGALRNYAGVAIDLCMDTHTQAMTWGTQHMDIYILD